MHPSIEPYEANVQQVPPYPWSRTGELFLVLSRNAANGMSYLREVPAPELCFGGHAG